MTSGRDKSESLVLERGSLQPLTPAGDHMPRSGPTRLGTVDRVNHLPDRRFINPPYKRRVAKPALDRAIERNHVDFTQACE
jgi:hypothetical protein